MRRRPIFAALALALGLLGWPRAAAAAPLVLEGDVPEGGPDHFFLEFDVPAGIREIEVRHDDLSDANILDWGLDDPAGFRGWGGGNTEPAIVGETAASRSYAPGPIAPGKWRVVVGKAKVVASPARYRVEIELRAAPTLPDTPRSTYAAAPPRRTETRWYAGDFHVHSRESGDARPALEEIVAFAKSRGLDFVEISDHNTTTQLDFFQSVQAREPDFLLLPGIEYTTYAGHANAVGATKWVDHRIGQPGVTIEAAADAVIAQGALLAINHPVLDIGDLCIGCAWEHDLAPEKVGAVEIATGGLKEGGQLFRDRAIGFWDALLDRGVKVPAIGGSDDHRAGVPTGSFQSPIGNPTTYVRAAELSERGILDALRRGATVVKLQDRDDPMVELEVAPRRGGDPIGGIGDTVGARSIVLRVRVTGGAGQQVRLVRNGAPLAPVAVTGDPFVHETVVEPPAAGEDRFRAEALVDEAPRTVTSHLWVRLDAAGPAVPPPEDDGCGVAPAERPLPWGAIALLGLAAVARRRARG